MRSAGVHPVRVMAGKRPILNDPRDRNRVREKTHHETLPDNFAAGASERTRETSRKAWAAVKCSKKRAYKNATSHHVTEFPPPQHHSVKTRLMS